MSNHLQMQGRGFVRFKVTSIGLSLVIPLSITHHLTGLPLELRCKDTLVNLRGPSL